MWKPVGDDFFGMRPREPRCEPINARRILHGAQHVIQTLGILRACGGVDGLQLPAYHLRGIETRLAQGLQLVRWITVHVKKQGVPAAEFAVPA